jgi:hypothetical protein
VTYLAGETAATAHELSVGDDAAPNTGAQGHHHEVRDAPAGAPLVLGERGAVGVVLTEHTGVAQSLSQQRPQIGAGGCLEIWREGQMSVAAHHARQPYANGHLGGINRLSFTQFVDLLDQYFRRGLARVKAFIVGSLGLHFSHDPSVAGHHESEGFRAAHVDADRDVAHPAASA